MQIESPELAQNLQHSLTALQVIRRNGAIVAFQADKISIALTKAFLAVEGTQNTTSSRIRDSVARLTQITLVALVRRRPDGGVVHIESIQDQVELALMRSGEHDVARAYVLYRERRASERETSATAPNAALALHMTDGDTRLPLDQSALLLTCQAACANLGDAVSARTIFDNALQTFYDGMARKDVMPSLILTARAMIEREPAYNKVTARLLLQNSAQEVFARPVSLADLPQLTIEHFPEFIRRGVTAELLDPRLGEYDLARLATALKPERDDQFDYLGLQTLYDRYFLHINESHIELPQLFFMRVAMGLALNEIDREARAIEFYHLISRFDFMCSTPTLFNSGTRHPQLSSCYLTTVSDDLDGIFQSIKENALLQKYAGGLGNDWTPVRALGSRIKGTNGMSQGVIPFLKVVNDTAVAVNQGGKRKGAVCAYLETWHLDIEEFLDLRKNTGDERRRTHDMNSAHWIPDLFMQRVAQNADWTLFSPDDTPDLHEKYGQAFAQAYCAYEARAARGEIPLAKKISAVQLWRKMLTMLFETGHPWITFKDACNLRSPQQHIGVVHSSNLCTEITLNTSDSETAVCNLGSVNLLNHLDGGQISHAKLAKTISTALRMLDNVVDVNFYATPKSRKSNLLHRPVGLGIMGFSDCLAQLGISYASKAAVEFADVAMEAVCYQAYWASSTLAQERGRYQTFAGSLWDQGVMPLDSIEILATARGGDVEVNRESRLDWAALKVQIARHGMRNSNCVAIAPTATISNIVGVSASIEPIYQNIYVKSNLSGEFVVVNAALVNELKALAIWDEVMLADLKYFNGSVARIERIPAELKARYATAFEIDPVWLIEAAAVRQKWIDQAQSLNLYLATPSGKKLDEIYKLAWLRGLKTTYYLRTLGASQMEQAGGRDEAVSTAPEPTPQFCAIDNPECEACQ